jgi:hypothetical protein
MQFSTPEELAAHLAQTIDDDVFIAKAVRLKFPEWGNAPRFVAKTYAVKREPRPRIEHQTPEYIGRNDPWKAGDGPDRAHEAHMSAGSETLLKAIQTGEGPETLLWGGHTQIFENDCTRAAAAVSRIHEREREVDALRVQRDPCRVCGVRADVGCRHQRVA